MSDMQKLAERINDPGYELILKGRGIQLTVGQDTRRKMAERLSQRECGTQPQR